MFPPVYAQLSLGVQFMQSQNFPFASITDNFISVGSDFDDQLRHNLMRFWGIHKTWAASLMWGIPSVPRN